MFGTLERPRGDDDLVGEDALIARLEHEDVAFLSRRAYRAESSIGSRKMRRVPFEEGDYLVAQREPGGRKGKSERAS
jgi:hypothetical protein